MRPPHAAQWRGHSCHRVFAGAYNANANNLEADETMTDGSRLPTPVRVPVADLVFDVFVSGPDDGPPVVLLHGFPETAYCWGTVARELADAGLRTVAPNQRGYSPQARPDGVDAYRIDHLVADVAGILDALNLPAADVVGHDWGAVVAWHLAAWQPARVRTLTTVSVPHPAAYGWAQRNDEDQQRRSSYITLFRRAGVAERVLLEDNAQRLRAMYGADMAADLIEEQLRVVGEPAALTAALNWYRATTRDMDDLPPVTVPTTYVWGTEDIAVGPAAAQRCATYVAAPYRFVALDGVSHWIPEEAPSLLVQAVLDRIQG